MSYNNHNTEPRVVILKDKSDAVMVSETSPMSENHSSLFTGRIVIVVVGEPRIKFFIHEEVLKKATDADYWRAIFNNGFKETQTDVLKLPEEGADVFDCFIKWAYSMASGFVEGERDFFAKIPDSLFLKLYGIAESYMIMPLADAVISALLDKASQNHWWNPWADFTKSAFEYLERRTAAMWKISWLIGWCKTP